MQIANFTRENYLCCHSKNLPKKKKKTVRWRRKSLVNVTKNIGNYSAVGIIDYSCHYHFISNIILYLVALHFHLFVILQVFNKIVAGKNLT